MEVGAWTNRSSGRLSAGSVTNRVRGPAYPPACQALMHDYIVILHGIDTRVVCFCRARVIMAWDLPCCHSWVLKLERLGDCWVMLDDVVGNLFLHRQRLMNNAPFLTESVRS